MLNIILKIAILNLFFYFNNVYTKISFANIVIISYENYNEEDFNLGSIKEHIKILTKKKYFIYPVNEITNLISNTKNFPDYSYGLIFASSKKQIITDIWPIFSKASLPFTVFIDPQNINKNKSYMSWNDINILKNNGVDIGIRSSPKSILKDITLYKIKLNIDPLSYLYRSGIWSEDEIGILNNNNIKIAFTDNSGPISKTMNKYKLPRFNMSGKFSNNERLKTVLETLPLEITNILPDGNKLIDNPPLYGFTLINEKQIPKCYTNNENKAEVNLIGKNRIEVRTKVFLGSKARINCVSKDYNNRLTWHGSLYWVNE